MDPSHSQSLARFLVYLGEEAAVVVADDAVGDAESVQVADHSLGAVRVRVVREQHPGVPHQLRCNTQQQLEYFCLGTAS